MVRKKDENETSPGQGHNVTGAFSPERLKDFIGKIEKLEEEKRAIGTDIRSLYQEAEASGLNGKVIRLIVSERRKDKEIVREHEELKRIYKEALGDFSSSPLGESAVSRAA